jgi:hypothetical protein
MTPHEVNTWIAFIILGAPLITVFGGPFGWCAMWILAALALFFSHPIIALALGVPWLLRMPLRSLLWGLFFGEGLRLSGVVGRLSRLPLASRQFPSPEEP